MVATGLKFRPTSTDTVVERKGLFSSTPDKSAGSYPFKSGSVNCQSTLTLLGFWGDSTARNISAVAIRRGSFIATRNVAAPIGPDGSKENNSAPLSP